MIRTYHVNIHTIGDFVHRTDLSTVDLEDLIAKYYPEAHGTFRCSILLVTRDRNDECTIQTHHIFMRITIV